ncbi:MAG: PilZ domain-containing protein [Coprococcus sp.]|nr:PilZ domain-containing protein [Coprococcus sp.]
MLLKDCYKCIIFGEEQGVQVPARVIHDDEQILLYFDDDTRLGAHTDRLRVDFCDSQVGYIKTICELNIRKSFDPSIWEPWVADCFILEVGEILQRQKDLRVPMDVEVEFSRTQLSGEIQFTSHTQGVFTGTIKNISVGGLFLATATRLTRGETFEFSYCFSKVNQKLQAMTLREQQLRKDLYGYGCQFIDVKNNVEREIRQFVYKQQLKKIW